MFRLVLSFCLVFVVIAFSSEDFYYKRGKKVFLEPMTNKTRTASTGLLYYQTRNGITLGIGDRVLVKLKNKDALESYIQRFHLKLLHSFHPNIFLLQTSDKTQTLTIANTLNDFDDVVYAHPDFTKKMRKR